jgi:MFS family permease
VVANDLVAREQCAQAISLMFAALTLADVLGVPVGTALGQAAGWRAAFWAVAAIGVIAGLAIIRYIPIGLPGSRGRLTREISRIRPLAGAAAYGNFDAGLGQHVQPLHLHHTAAGRRHRGVPRLRISTHEPRFNVDVSIRMNWEPP